MSLRPLQYRKPQFKETTQEIAIRSILAPGDRMLREEGEVW